MPNDTLTAFVKAALKLSAENSALKEYCGRLERRLEEKEQIVTRDVFYSEVEYFCPECGKMTKIVKPQITVEPGGRFTCQHCGVGYEIEYRQYINLPQEKEEQK